MTTTLVIAPHPDDETIGCGGTLSRRCAIGDEVHWLIVTDMTENTGFSADDMARRDTEIARVAEAYGFASTIRLRFPAAGIDGVPERALVEAISKAIRRTGAEEVFVPWGGDVHGDHRRVFSAAEAALKWFRQPIVRRMLAYETLSETEAAFDPARSPFRPTVYSDISETLERKIEVLSIYDGEMEAYPFPRSEEAVRALAVVRGMTAGFHAAEAFVLLREYA